MRLRLQKYIAQSGICSRRAAETLIKEGKVTLNGKHTAQIGESVDPRLDTITVDGQVLKPLKKQYFLFHKPAKVLCSRTDPAGRFCFYDLIPSSMHHLVYAGRLDFMSEGLLVLSNDGEFVHRLTHPKFGIDKCYHVWVKGIQNLDNFIQRIVHEGILDQNECLKAKTARFVSESRSVKLLEIILVEGRNREIRRMVKSVGGNIVRLVRKQMGPFTIQGLRSSKWRSFDRKEMNQVEQILTNNTTTACHT